ncbi:MAG TPA: aldehyde dehydrogenase, partial [Chloroflexia bacterium]|nr:aldehyde dehydrogenase [Chloroflexia bacterium]
ESATYQMRIGGEWRGAGDGRTRPVLNPATGDAFDVVPEGTREDARAALEAAQAAQPAWEALTGVERAAYVRRIVERITAGSERLARLVVQEQGKPLVEARGEIAGTAGFFEYFTTFARAPLGEIVASDNRDEDIWIRNVPFGVVVGIIPWNYPAALFARKVAPALMAGNTIVVKPHEDTPLSALALAKICEEAGVPPGVVNVVTGAGTVVGEALVRDEITQLVTVTGSVRAGRQILAAAAENITVVSLELGGKAPFIVMDDANLDLAVRNALHARFVNCGQVCTCNERTYVHRRVYDQFVERYVAAAGKLRLGDPMRTDIDLGPKVNLAELEKLERMVARAQEQGAQVALGGKRPDGAEFQRGFWYAPTVLTNVRNDMDIMQQEIFGPISPIMAFDDFEEAIALANDSKYGLTAYLFTDDLKRMMRAVQAIRFGEVYINRIGPEQFQGFHTGYRLSGMGGDDGRHGFEHYFRKKTVYVNYGTPPTAGLMPYTTAETELPPQ